MSQNYNLNSSFGFNVSSGNINTATQKQAAEASQNSSGLFDLMTNYVDKYENVLNGDVANEINMYSRQMMIVGMNLKAADKNIRRFDMNV